MPDSVQPTNLRSPSPRFTALRLLKRSAVAAALALTVTACGGTSPATQSSVPSLTVQGVRTTTPISVTFPFTLTSPCTGEILNGLVTFSGEERLVTDASGGTHSQVRLTYSSTYTGNRGTTFTESGKGNIHLNLPSSGIVNAVSIFNSVITGDDGTTFLAKERFVFVMDANGIVRVERNNLETNAYRCKRG